ncbi:primase C-terminal domain-containing protein [Rheinheimera muenzenbergensis]|uniref:Primase C-terminal domain-containing protein n=2 Tax=Rheinheimera muenzenbergensis TaxID=1193628 RepID=A0ABU8C7U1_9GAMM
MLFEELRFYAYSIVNREREQGTFQSFNRLLDAYAHDHNNFKRRGSKMNLSVPEVSAIVKSVARWTWDRYRGTNRCHRGAMGLDPSLPLQEKQRLSAQRTHESRQRATESRIRAAAKSLIQMRQKLTQAAIAAATRLSRQIVAKYSAIVEEVITESISNVIPMATTKSKNVNYGAHQISASRRADELDGAEIENCLKMSLTLSHLIIKLVTSYV